MYTSPNRSHKKRAVGDSRSPTSSVRTCDGESKDLDMYTSPNRSHKKRAVGDGRSPTSSVRTLYSNTSERKLANATSLRGVLSANRAEGRGSMKQESIGSRPPTTGKRLFQPDFYSQPLFISSRNAI
jgi:hypothetical protein